MWKCFWPTGAQQILQQAGAWSLQKTRAQLKSFPVSVSCWRLENSSWRCGAINQRCPLLWCCRGAVESPWRSSSTTAARAACHLLQPAGAACLLRAGGMRSFISASSWSFISANSLLIISVKIAGTFISLGEWSHTCPPSGGDVDKKGFRASENQRKKGDVNLRQPATLNVLQRRRRVYGLVRIFCRDLVLLKELS